MPFLPGMPTEKVTIIHGEGTADERRTDVRAHIQPKVGFFESTALIYEGDIVEALDPRGGVRRLLVSTVDIFTGTRLDHIEAHWGRPPDVRRPAVARVTPGDSTRKSPLPPATSTRTVITLRQ